MNKAFTGYLKIIFIISSINNNLIHLFFNDENNIQTKLINLNFDTMNCARLIININDKFQSNFPIGLNCYAKNL